jgi:hypothetical protein
VVVGADGFEPPKENQQIYSLPHLATLVYSLKRASGGTRTPDQLITNQLLYQLSYTGIIDKSETMLKNYIIYALLFYLLHLLLKKKVFFKKRCKDSIYILINKSFREKI